MEVNTELITAVASAIAAVGIAARGIVKKLSAQMAELKPNGGGSLRDAVDRVETKMDTMHAQLNGMLELHGDGFYVANAEGECAWVSRRWIEITGVSLSDALGEGWIAGMHQDDRATVLAEWTVFASAPQNLVFDIIHRTAKNVRVRNRAIVLMNAQGQEVGYLGYYTELDEDDNPKQ